MSMYAQLLALALDGHPGSERPAAELAAELLRCRDRLARRTSSPGQEAAWTPGRVADQLAYDVALIELASYLGIPCQIHQFDQHQRARTQLERALVRKAVELGPTDDGAGHGAPP